MAIQWTAGDSFTCLSADTKPILVPANTKAIETDTDNIYKFNGTSWALLSAAGGLTASSTTTLTNKTIDFDLNTVPNFQTGAYYTIYRSGANTKCRDNVTGTIVSSSSTAPEVPIQYALDNGIRKKIFVANGTYTFSAGFTGLTFSQPETRMELDPGALLTVPNGYAGACFIFGTGSLSNCILDGGRIGEAGGSPQRLWIGFYLHATTGGLNANRFYNTYIRYAGTAIKLHVDGVNGWINGNIFDKIFMDLFVKGIEFVDTGVSTFGMANNRFDKLTIQMWGGVSTHGVKDIQGDRNEFIGVNVWDALTGMVTANILASADSTLIWGGIMTSKNFTDLSDASLIWDSFIPLTIGRKLNRSILTLPSFGQWGVMQGNQAAGDGLLNALTVVGTHSNVVSYADGLYGRYTSGTTLGDNAGTKYTATYTYRGWNPTFKAKFRINDTASTVRSFMGWFGSSTDFTGNDMLNAIPGIGIGHRTTDTNFQLFRNDSTGATNATSTGVAIDTATHSFEINALDYAATPRYNVYFDGVLISQPTTELPPQTTAQFLQFEIENNESAVAKTLDRFYIDARPGI